MKFNLISIHLWKDGNNDPRTLLFEPNKVNVITGLTGTGKTTIIHIINYCLLTSKPKIPVPEINERVEWYGIKFHINDRNIFIARKRPNAYDQPSGDLYFSSVGQIPEYPSVTIKDTELKTMLEREFSIDDNLTVPYGGRFLKAGTKISFRYFLLMNTQYEDTIADSDTFFDFKIHDEDRYKEALDRVFDLILSVGTVEKILLQQKLFDLQKELNTLNNKERAQKRGKEELDRNVLELLNRAQQYGLIEGRLFTATEAKDQLKELIEAVITEIKLSPLKEFEELNSRKNRLLLRLRNLESLKRNTEKYRAVEEKDLDSLKPIELIERYYDDNIVKTFELKFYVDALKENLTRVRANIQSRERFAISVENEASALRAEIVEIEKDINKFPQDIEELRGEAQKYIFIGELQTLLRLHDQDHSEVGAIDVKSKQLIEEQVDDLQKQLLDLDYSRSIQIAALNDRINEIKEQVKGFFGSYRDYKAFFNVKEKKLNLIPPNSATPASNIGSRSNHMFMHLIMILGLHKHMLLNKNKYVPQFLILDQPSQPYLPKTEPGKLVIEDDRLKLQGAFDLLNSFITMVKDEMHEDFQIILLEHAEEEYWQGLDKFHVVDNFRDGRALVM